MTWGITLTWGKITLGSRRNSEEYYVDKIEEEGKFIKPGCQPSISHIEGWTNVLGGWTDGSC